MLATFELQPIVILVLVVLVIWQAARPQRSRTTTRENVHPAPLEASRYIHVPVTHEGEEVDLLFTPSEFDAGVARARRQPEDISRL